MSSTPRSSPICGVSSSPAASPPSGSPPKIGPRRRATRSTGLTRAAVTSDRGWPRRTWYCGTRRSAACRLSRCACPTPTERATTQPDAARQADLGGGRRQDAVLHQGLGQRGRRCRGRRRSTAPRRRERVGKGERYIISDRMMTAQELYETAADGRLGRTPPRFGVPLWVMFVLGCANDAANLVRKRDSALTRTSVRLMHLMPATGSRQGRTRTRLAARTGPRVDQTGGRVLSGTPAKAEGAPRPFRVVRFGVDGAAGFGAVPVHSVFDDDDEPANA